MRNVLFSPKTLLAAVMAFVALLMPACSDDDPQPRHQDDILGKWTDGKGRILYFSSEMTVFDIRLESKDGEKTYTLMQDSYCYEPGYNFVVFLDFMQTGETDTSTDDSETWEDVVSPEVYQVSELTPDVLKWCWADNLSDDKYKGLSKKEILGMLIKEADKGFHTDPSKAQTFSRLSDSEFQKIVDDYKIWEFMDYIPDDEEE